MDNNINKRDSFIFYRSFFEAINLLPNKKDAMRMVYAIADYALDGEEPELDGMTLMLWKTIRPQLEANRRRYVNGCKGGAPQGNRNNPNGRKGKEPEEIQSSANPRPSLQDIEAYVTQNRLLVKPDAFYYYYESRNWLSGNTPIANWQALLRQWHAKEMEKHPEQSSQPGLGIGEFLNDKGERTYGNGETIVPAIAPPRPSKAHWWNPISNAWDRAA